MPKMSVNERLVRLRRSYRRLEELLQGDERNTMVLSEITHVAAHLAEHVQALDKHLTDGKALPISWAGARCLSHEYHDRAEETAPTP